MGQKEEIELEAYKQCFVSKHHYDVLSWTISGAIVIILTALIAIMVKIEPAFIINIPVSLRLLLGIIGIYLSLIWLLIYERNRFWGEVANETARDIEREHGISGPAIEFMKRSLDKEVILKNTDEFKKKYIGKKGESSPCTENPKINIPIHWGIRILIFIMVIVFLLLIFCQFKI